MAAAMEYKLGVKSSSVSACPCISWVHFTSLLRFLACICLLIPLQKASCKQNAFFLQSSTDTGVLWKMEKLLSVVMFSILKDWNKSSNGALCKCLEQSRHFNSTESLENEDSIFLTRSLICTVPWNRKIFNMWHSGPGVINIFFCNIWNELKIWCKELKIN